VANVTVASINASGLYTSTGNLLITQANSIATAAIEDGAVTNAKLTLAANASNIKTALNASGDAPIYAARAWVNFNGTGTVAIRAAGNVASITDRGTGKYTVNLTTAMPDANYASVAAAAKIDSNDDANQNISTGTTTLVQTTTEVFITTGVGNGDLGDSPAVSVAIFR
jgi:hypothetical protein